MTIAKILEGKGRNVVSITADRTVADAIALLTKSRIGAVPVIDDGEVRGIFSERDVVHGLARDGKAALDLLVADLMTAPAITVALDESVLAALALMTRRRIRHLPVMDGNECIGIVSIGDLVKHRIERIEHEAAAMRSYIQQA